MRSVALALLACAPLHATPSALWGEQGSRWAPDGRLPDFSHAGYACGEREIPVLPVRTDVRRHGARGDGTVDDSAAFLAAIRSVAASGRAGAILVPAGRYLIRQRIVIDSPGIVLRGVGPEKSVLVCPTPLNEIAPDWGTTTSGRRTSNYSWSGGFVTFSGRDAGQPVGTIVRPVPRGGNRFTLDHEPQLEPGDPVLIHLQDDADRSLLAHLYSGDPGDLSKIPPGSHRIELSARVRSVDGRSVRIDRPLRCDVRPEWKPRLSTFKPTVRHGGVEHLGFEFPARAYAGHFTELGYNALAFAKVADCWARDLRIVNADSGIFVSGRNCTLSDIVCELDGATEHRATFGHHGISLTGCDNLLTRFDLRQRFIHDITVSKGSGNVASKGRGLDLALDHHERAPFDNLFTDLDAGEGSRLWKSGGGQALGRHCGARGTFWNIRSKAPQKHPGAFGPPSLNLVALPTREPSVLEPDGRWFEAVPPERIRPQDLHQAQLACRLGTRP